jgi:hypothetical protein
MDASRLSHGRQPLSFETGWFASAALADDSCEVDIWVEDEDVGSRSALGGPLSAGLLEDVERGVLRAMGVPIP